MLLANLALLAGRASRPEDAVNLAYTEEGPQRVVYRRAISAGKVKHMRRLDLSRMTILCPSNESNIVKRQG